MGDEILVAYANRYATDQYESEVPTTLGPCQLVASGGIASQVITRSRDVRTATDITPIGLLGDERGRPINVRDFALPSIDEPASRPKTFAVLGTSMNSGKTTTIKQLVQGFAQAGYKGGGNESHRHRLWRRLLVHARCGRAPDARLHRRRHGLDLPG
ncbi:MAG: hypothetical protein IPJ15_14190 [Actinomycetales bacterium]|nr:hypothetical protein [Candidatus Phosphoribacter baldrii]